MEEVVKIRGTLVKVNFSDLVFQGELREGMRLFWKDPETKKFISTYMIPYHADYWVDEVLFLFRKGILYKLTGVHSHLDFSFKLLLRPADDIDVFWKPGIMKENTIFYYPSENEDRMLGPYIITAETKLSEITKLFMSRSIYVPCTKQTFEEIKLLKSA